MWRRQQRQLECRGRRRRATAVAVAFAALCDSASCMGSGRQVGWPFMLLHILYCLLSAPRAHCMGTRFVASRQARP